MSTLWGALRACSVLVLFYAVCCLFTFTEAQTPFFPENGGERTPDCSGTIDECGVCNGDNSSKGCDGVCGSGKVVGGCDNTCGSTKTIDACGVCGGAGLNPSGCCGTLTRGCDGICGSGKLIGGCDKKCGSIKTIDSCGICGGPGPNTTGCCGSVIKGCDGVCGSTKINDVCGVCGGPGLNASGCCGTQTKGCDGVCGSNKINDVCGVCAGPGLNVSGCCGTLTKGCDGVCGSTKINDVCGVCGGPGLNASGCCGTQTKGCDGVCGSNKVNDVCGVCAGPGLNASGCCGTQTKGCDGVCGSNKVIGCDGICGSGVGSYMPTCGANQQVVAGVGPTFPGCSLWVCDCNPGTIKSYSGFTLVCSTDLCPADPNKAAPGQCGCGNPDTDRDGDGIANCVDPCPGKVGGLNASGCCGTAVKGCDGVCGSTKTVDVCGVCGGAGAVPPTDCTGGTDALCLDAVRVFQKKDRRSTDCNRISAGRFSFQQCFPNWAGANSWAIEVNTTDLSKKFYVYGWSANTCIAGSKVCSCFRRFGEGCFPPETKIEMGDRSLKRIDQLAVGEQIWSPMRGKPVRVKSIIEGPENEGLIEVRYGKVALKMSTKHPVPTPGAIKIAKELRVDDEIYGADGQLYTLESVTQLPPAEGQRVINVELDTESMAAEDHYLVAEGVITGDFTLQKQANKDKQQR